MPLFSTFSVVGLSSGFRTILAASGDNENSLDPTIVNTALSFTPIAVFLLVLYFLFRKQMRSPLAKLQRANVERHIQHMQRMEEQLERIATQLEQRGKP